MGYPQGMPWTDWQFWIVTLLALGGLVMVVRPLIPSRRGGAGCGSCPSNSKSGDPKVGKRTTLTIEGRRAD